MISLSSEPRVFSLLITDHTWEIRSWWRLGQSLHLELFALVWQHESETVFATIYFCDLKHFQIIWLFIERHCRVDGRNEAQLCHLTRNVASEAKQASILEMFLKTMHELCTISPGKALSKRTKSGLMSVKYEQEHVLWKYKSRVKALLNTVQLNVHVCVSLLCKAMLQKSPASLYVVVWKDRNYSVFVCCAVWCLSLQ